MYACIRFRIGPAPQLSSAAEAAGCHAIMNVLKTSSNKESVQTRRIEVAESEHGRIGAHAS